jgi:hypothetical protein
MQFISCAIPTYQAEMSTEITQRGPDVAATCTFLISGIAIAYWVDLGFTRMDNQLSWVSKYLHSLLPALIVSKIPIY